MNLICLDSIHDTKILTEKKTDIFLHILAHIDINSVASNYDSDYVKYISDLKGEKPSSLYESLKGIDDDNLVFLSFMPAFFTTIDSMFRGLRYLSTPGNKMKNGFAETESMCLLFLQDIYRNTNTTGLLKFAETAKSEYDLFYSEYWESRSEEYLRMINQFKEIWESEDNCRILSFLRNQGLPSISIYLSEGMRKNGRGMRSSSACALAKMPENSKEVFESYYIAIHELLHQVVDGITQSILEIDGQRRSLNPKDDEYSIHEQFENSVILAQHLLMRKSAYNWTKEYFTFVSKIFEADIKNDSEFYSFLKVDARIKKKLESIVNAQSKVVQYET